MSHKDRRKLSGWKHQANGGYDHQFYKREKLDALDKKERDWTNYLHQKNSPESADMEPPKEYTEQDEALKVTYIYIYIYK